MLKKKFGERERNVQIDEIEYNDIVFLSFSAAAFDPGRLGSKQIETIRICKLAKSVRDGIAHLRAPDPSSVMELVSEMDCFIG